MSKGYSNGKKYGILALVGAGALGYILGMVTSRKNSSEDGVQNDCLDYVPSSDEQDSTKSENICLCRKCCYHDEEIGCTYSEDGERCSCIRCACSMCPKYINMECDGDSQIESFDEEGFNNAIDTWDTGWVDKGAEVGQGSAGFGKPEPVADGNRLDGGEQPLCYQEYMRCVPEEFFNYRSACICASCPRVSDCMKPIVKPKRLDDDTPEPDDDFWSGDQDTPVGTDNDWNFLGYESGIQGSEDVGNEDELSEEDYPEWLDNDESLDDTEEILGNGEDVFDDWNADDTIDDCGKNKKESSDEEFDDWDTDDNSDFDDWSEDYTGSGGEVKESGINGTVSESDVTQGTQGEGFVSVYDCIFGTDYQKI